MNEKTSEELSFKPRMPGNDPNRLNLLRTFFLSLAFLSVLVTLTYYNFAVPLLLFEMIPDDFSIFFGIFRENSLVGTIMTIDNMLAVILQPYFAALSDRTRSKFGRRMPFIIIGVLVCAFTFAIAPWIKILLGFVLILFFFNLFMSFYRSSALVLLADYTPEKVRSAGSGLQQFIANFGTIIAFLVMPISGLIIPQVQETTRRDLGFSVVSLSMLICLGILYLTVKETPTGTKFFEKNDYPINLDSVSFEIVPTSEEELVQNIESNWANFAEIFRIQDKSIFLLLLAVFCWFTGFGAIEAFFSAFGKEYLLLPEDGISLLMLIYPVSMILSSVPTGLLGQKIGRKKSLYIGVIGLILLMSILSFVVVPAKNVLLIAIILAFIGFFWMDIIVNTFPMVWNLAPEEKVGGYTGVYYTFNQAAAIASPILMGLVFDVLGYGMGANRFLFMFPFILACLIIALVFLFRVKGGETKSNLS